MQNTHIHFIFVVILVVSILGCSPQNTPTPNPMPLPSITPPAALETVEGTFRNQIRLLEENMPRAGSEGYVIPSEEEQAGFGKLVSLIYRKEFADAIQLANKHYYRLNYYVDKGEDSAASYLLREQKPIQKGWGLYAFRVESTSKIIVEAPHPLYDRRTTTIAVDIYRALNAHALLIAGAHRNANSDGSADVAHVPESIFHSVHGSLVQQIQAKSDIAIVLQIHGFHTSKHEGYPQAVLGFGKNMQPAEITLAQALESALSAQGIKVGLCVDETWWELCGRTNDQGAASNGAVFIHMELDEKIRKNDEALIAALLEVFGQ
jgi:hypothetical protein